MARLAGGFRSVVQYFQGAAAEFRRVTWPTSSQLVQYTVLVLVTLVISVLLLTAYDYGLQHLFDTYLLR